MIPIEAGLGKHRLPPTLLTSLAIVVVAALFVGVIVIGQRYAADVDGMARSLATGAAPRIELLSAARGRLRGLTFELRDTLRAAEDGVQRDRGPIERERRSLDGALARYLAFVDPSGDRPPQYVALREVDAYRKALEIVLAQLDHGDLPGAHAAMVEQLMPASDRADHAIETLEALEADRASRTGAAINRTRLHASRLTYLLAALAAGAALLVTCLVWWMNRSFALMAKTRTLIESLGKQLAERRASELEIFAARVAHDLRNPLASIGMRLHLAQREAADPSKLKSGLERMMGSVHHASRIIDGLLDFARAGGAPDPEARVDLVDAVRAVLDDLAPEIAESGIRLRLQPLPVVALRCSVGPMLSVLGNLLRNAVKFMADAHSEERMIALRAVQAGTSWRIEVEDTGPGIPFGAAEKIFEPYVRGAERGQPGIGLGLATVKKIVEAHGGHVGVRSVAPHGSCFWFELPLANDPSTPVPHR